MSCIVIIRIGISIDENYHIDSGEATGIFKLTEQIDNATKTAG
jgi:hypothetical protein